MATSVSSPRETHAVIQAGASFWRLANTHLAARLTDRGISPGQDALETSEPGGASFIGCLLTGALLDRYFGPRVAFLLLTIMAGGILLLAPYTNIPTLASNSTLFSAILMLWMPRYEQESG